MKLRFIRWLLRMLGTPRPILPGFSFFAIVEPNQRIADVTTNRHRARAIATELNLKGKHVKVWRCVPVEEERP